MPHLAANLERDLSLPQSKSEAAHKIVGLAYSLDHFLEDAKRRKIRQTGEHGGASSRDKKWHRCSGTCGVERMAVRRPRQSTSSTSRGCSSINYVARWARYLRDGTRVRIPGPSKSECTMVIGHLNRDHVCVTPEGCFGFRLHQSTARGAATVGDLTGPHQGVVEPPQQPVSASAHLAASSEVYRFLRRCEKAARYSSFSVVKYSG